MPRPKANLETVLYVDALEAAARFYLSVLQLGHVHGDDRMQALRVSDQNLLLLFRTGATREPVEVPGGVIPPHDGDGPMHVAFAIDAGDVAPWLERLDAHGVAIEGRVNWPSGATSLYFRDPAGNLVELATSDLWGSLGISGAPNDARRGDPP
jgi:catechol 2,3-dioxygenase-like lactoylglutathione lyase family enzyme